MVLLISECLLGVACRYDGKSKPMPQELIDRLREKYTLVPICPEQLGGLPTPRPPAERIGELVLTNAGGDVTEQYMRGACESLRIAKIFGAKNAMLKARSPSCGRDEIYDGTHAGILTKRHGTTAEMFLEHGIRVYTEEEAQQLI